MKPLQLFIAIILTSLFAIIKTQGQGKYKEIKQTDLTNKNFPSKYFEGKWIGFYQNDTIEVHLKKQKSFFKPVKAFVNLLVGEVYINSIRIQSTLNKSDTCAILNGLVDNTNPNILGASFYDMNINETYIAEFKLYSNNTIEWKLKFMERVNLGNNYSRPNPSVPMTLKLIRVSK